MVDGKAAKQAGQPESRGATALTYALGVGLIALVALTAITSIGDSIDSLFGTVSSTMTEPEATAPTADPSPEAAFYSQTVTVTNNANATVSDFPATLTLNTA